LVVAWFYMGNVIISGTDHIAAVLEASFVGD